MSFITGAETVTYELRAGVAWITLNRPEVHNALNMKMRDELWTLLDVFEIDDEARAVVFRGAGEAAFSSGADLTEFGSAPSVVEARKARIERDLWGRLYALDKPAVAALHGYALGAGCELALLCDVRIASEDALIGLPEVGLGYIPAAGGTQTLPRLIGLGRALDMICTGDPVDAGRALDYGLVDAVVPRTGLYAAAEGVSRQLAAAPRPDVRAAKEAVREGRARSLPDALGLRLSFDASTR